MSIGTIWNHRDFIERVYGKEDAIEFEQIVKKYQAEQIGFERERIIKLLEGDAGQQIMCLDCSQELIALIKGEK